MKLFISTFFATLAVVAAGFSPQAAPFTTSSSSSPSSYAFTTSLRGGSSSPPLASDFYTVSQLTSPRVRSTFGTMLYNSFSPLVKTTPSSPSTDQSETAKYEIIFVLGGPGAGKGTQCEKMTSHYGFVHLSVGDLLRLERQNPNSEQGQYIESFLKEGKLVPGDITLGLLDKAMGMYPKGTVFLIDGFPRNYDNLKGWQRILCAKAKVLSVLVYDCPEDELERRILSRGETSGRSDDNLSAAKKRFATFTSETLPVVKTLEEIGLRVRHFRGELPLKDVWRETRREVDGLLTDFILTRCQELEELLKTSNTASASEEDKDKLESMVDKRIYEQFLVDSATLSAKMKGQSIEDVQVDVLGKVAMMKYKVGERNVARVWEIRGGEWVLISYFSI